MNQSEVIPFPAGGLWWLYGDYYQLQTHRKSNHLYKYFLLSYYTKDILRIKKDKPCEEL